LSFIEIKHTDENFEFVFKMNERLEIEKYL